MLNEYAVTTAKETLETAPAELQVQASSGFVTHVLIEFPAGCGGLVGMRISQGLHQIWPATSGGWFRTDNFTISIAAHHTIRPGETLLRIETYNEDTAHEHTVTLSLTIKPLLDAPQQIVGVVTTILPDEVIAQLAHLTKLYDNAVLMETLNRERIAPALERLVALSQKSIVIDTRRLTLAELTRL